MSEAFLDWWREHYSMANLAMGAASDAWDAATAAERERCAKIAETVFGQSDGDDYFGRCIAPSHPHSIHRGRTMIDAALT